MEASLSIQKIGVEGRVLFFPAAGDFCQRMYCLCLSPMLWLFILFGCWLLAIMTAVSWSTASGDIHLENVETLEKEL